MRAATCMTVSLLAWGIFTSPGQAQRLDLAPEIALESRLFPEAGAFTSQLKAFQGGVVLSGDARWTSENRRTRVTIEPYLRLDSADENRSYFDLREASVSHRFGDWRLLVGSDQVFWGVAESRNVVDIINQFDTVEDFDQTEKLGQPMVRLSRRTRLGTFEFYYLPYFRKQRFAGHAGRLRFEPTVDVTRAEFERNGEEWAGDLALRYSQRIGDFDVGVHAFHGTSRNPFLIQQMGQAAFTPVYQALRQGGADLQYTKGAWLLKFEGVVAEQGGDTYTASVIGAEYSFFDMGQSGIDLGLIGEFLYDDRNQSQTPITLFQNDIFIGARLTFNDPQDTSLLVGGIVDTQSGGLIGSAEFKRRIGDTAMLELEGRFFRGSNSLFLQAFQRDSHLQIRWTQYF